MHRGPRFPALGPWSGLVFSPLFFRFTSFRSGCSVFTHLTGGEHEHMALILVVHYEQSQTRFQPWLFTDRQAREHVHEHHHENGIFSSSVSSA